MTQRIARGLLLLALVPLGLTAGEKPAALMTGNARIDFFGGALAYSNSLTLRGDSTLPYLSPTGSTEEKSPWLAGALSLAIPGAGEVYSKSYLKGGIFFAVELTSWFLVYHYNQEGNKQTDAFQQYANDHWSAVRYSEWTLNNIGVLSAGAMTRTQWEGRVFYPDYDPTGSNPPPFTSVNWDQLNTMEDSIGLTATGEGNGYTHHLPSYGTQQYYELIGKYPEFSRGWDDADQSAILSTDLPLKNNSQRFVDYQLARAEANHQYDVSQSWLMVVVVNHVLSAFDAYWSATRYNKTLHAEAHMNFVPTPYGLTPYTEMKLAYNF